jgi:iron(III) transport system ATP-binding protein
VSRGALTVTGLTKRFGAVTVLNGLGLQVAAGEFVALLGPSGSGKTTLLRVLAGFERPDAGTVLVGDRVFDDDAHHERPERRRVGYVSQDGSLFPHLSVAANVGFGLARRDRRGPRVAELLALVGLTDHARHYPHELSGGQQQRVALARALAVDPDVVLLDEPFAALDDNLRRSLRAEVRAILATHGATVILVTHDQDEALSTADRVAVLRDGTVAQVATPADLYQHPTDAGLAALVGAANVIAGTRTGDMVTTALGVHAVANTDGPIGEVDVLVRPEQVSLGDVRSNTPTARITATSFHGHDVVVALDAAGTELTVRALGPCPWRVGDTVSATVTASVVVLARG